MTSLALAIATKGEWDPDQLLRDLRSAGADASTEIHIACDPEHAPTTPPDGLAVHTKANASLFELWGLAIAQSRSDWVAILHADALPASGWFAAMHEAIARDLRTRRLHGARRAAVRTGRTPAWSAYLTEYVQFHRPLNPPLSEVPGNNLVLPRARLESSGDFSKTRLLRQGLSPQPVEDGSRSLLAPVPARRILRPSLPPRTRLRGGTNPSTFAIACSASHCCTAPRPNGADCPPGLAPQASAPRELALAAGDPGRRKLLVRW